MKLSQEILESLYIDFYNHVSEADGEKFSSFATSRYVDSNENYKYAIYNEARGSLNTQSWKPEQIGTGRIKGLFDKILFDSLEYKGQSYPNNLLYWEKKKKFRSLNDSKLEEILFGFYKRNEEQKWFEELEGAKLDYQTIAYICFIKDREKFLPISQKNFDLIFRELLKIDFKTSRKLSWDNYIEFISLVKEVKKFLKTKVTDVTLLDAHSFLWTLGKLKIAGFESESKKKSKSESISLKRTREQNQVTRLSKQQWMDIVRNREITRDIDLKILQVVYSFDGHRASTGEIGHRAGYSGDNTAAPINSEMARYAKRIAKYYTVTFNERETGDLKYWDFFFDGSDEHGLFIYELRKEIIDALEELDLTGTEQIYPDDLPDNESQAYYEGLRKIIQVNAYERSRKAREACKARWGAICAVCDFDFEKVYGDIGKGYIHVHHITPIHKAGKEYKVDYKNDLIPVCPNCHSMLHKRKEPYSIEELKNIIDGVKQRNSN